MPKLDNYEQEVDAQIGERIRLRRVELGISQAELAERIGMSFQQVQKYERGANRIASSILLRVADAVKCSPGELLDIRARTRKAPKETATEREISAAMHRLSRLKSAAARRRILLTLDTLLREAEGASPGQKRKPKPASQKAVRPSSPRKRPASGKAPAKKSRR